MESARTLGVVNLWRVDMSAKLIIVGFVCKSVRMLVLAVAMKAVQALIRGLGFVKRTMHANGMDGQWMHPSDFGVKQVLDILPSRVTKRSRSLNIRTQSAMDTYWNIDS